jgi:hypothetical protein
MIGVEQDSCKLSDKVLTELLNWLNSKGINQTMESLKELVKSEDESKGKSDPFYHSFIYSSKTYQFDVEEYAIAEKLRAAFEYSGIYKHLIRATNKKLLTKKRFRCLQRPLKVFISVSLRHYKPLRQ